MAEIGSHSLVHFPAHSSAVTMMTMGTLSDQTMDVAAFVILDRSADLTWSALGGLMMMVVVVMSRYLTVEAMFAVENKRTCQEEAADEEEGEEAADEEEEEEKEIHLTRTRKLKMAIVEVEEVEGEVDGIEEGIDDEVEKMNQ